MTKETYQLAERLNHDLTVLNAIKFQQDKKHWIGFRTPDNDSVDSLWTAELRNDFQEFIDGEIEKVNRLFDEL